MLKILSDFFTILLILAAIAGILYLSYFVSRKLGSSMMRTGGSSNIKVIERAFVDRDKSVVIVRVGQEDYLLGVSPNNVTLLQKLEEGQVIYDEPDEDAPLPAAQFASMVKNRLKKEK